MEHLEQEVAFGHGGSRHLLKGQSLLNVSVGQAVEGWQEVASAKETFQNSRWHRQLTYYCFHGKINCKVLNFEL